MDADIESFLRDKRSLIQTIGRAARNVDAKVLMYADVITKSMQAAIQETERRRHLQQEYNAQHGITPQSVQREVVKSISPLQERIKEASAKKSSKKKAQPTSPEHRQKLLADLEFRMQKAAEDLDFETAIALRDEWLKLAAELETF